MFDIIKKEVVHSLRNKKNLILNIVFPLILMMILGMVFSQRFNKDLSYEGSSLAYYTTSEGQLSKGLEKMIPQFEELGIQVEQLEDEKQGINRIEENINSCYLLIDEENNKVDLYKSKRENVVSSLVEGIVRTYIDRYNLVSKVYSINPSYANSMVQKNVRGDFVKTQSIDKKAQARSIDYYGISMLTLIILYSITSNGMTSMVREKDYGTLSRIIRLPISKFKIFMGITLGNLLVTIMQVLTLMIFSNKLFGVNYGQDIGTVLIIIISQIVVCIAIGISLGVLIKNHDLAKGLASIIIPILTFAGGGYYPIERIGSKMLENISRYSPIKRINDSIFQVIYQKDYTSVIPTVVVTLSVALVILTITTIIFNRREDIL